MRARVATAVALAAACLPLLSCAMESSPKVLIDDAKMSVVRERLRVAMADFDSVATPVAAKRDGPTRLVVCPLESGEVTQSRALRRWELVDAAQADDIMEMTPRAGAAAAGITEALKQRGWVADGKYPAEGPTQQFDLRKAVDGYTITGQVWATGEAIFAVASVEEAAACSQDTRTGGSNRG